MAWKQQGCREGWGLQAQSTPQADLDQSRGISSQARESPHIILGDANHHWSRATTATTRF
ncbi:MAG: hypothetical protein OXC96_00870 [Cyanobacteria bacterium MAG CAR1_bin_15]|nr:hypothetical protein [Cyanobacteria bacterium MAG CAR1_bin_15]